MINKIFLIISLGSPHQLLPFDELVPILKTQIEELKTKMTKKEDELASYFKNLLKKESKFAEETKEMIRQLHSTRDAQVKRI